MCSLNAVIDMIMKDYCVAINLEVDAEVRGLCLPS